MWNLILTSLFFWTFYVCPFVFTKKNFLSSKFGQFNVKIYYNQFSLLNFQSMSISSNVMVSFVFELAGAGQNLNKIS